MNHLRTWFNLYHTCNHHINLLQLRNLSRLIDANLSYVYVRPYSSEGPSQVRKFEVGECSRIGRRNRSEDRLSIQKLTDKIRLYAVYDGHCGSFAVDYVENVLPRLLKKSVESIGVELPADERNEHIFQERIKSLTEKAFSECEYGLISAINEGSNLPKRDIVGSTATIALISDDIWLTIAHIGDSKSFLMHGNEMLPLCDDHSPNNDKEASRITDAGGWISYNTRLYPMVNGHLAMTRSFGDMALKEFGVISEPFIRQVKLDHNKDKCLLLCTDGLTDTVNDIEIYDVINRCQDPREAAKELTSVAQQYGSTDDTTAIVVALGGWNKPSAIKITVNFSPYRTVIGARGDG